MSTIKRNSIRLAALVMLLATVISFTPTAFASDPIKVGGVAKVAHTDGGRARLRSGPSTSAEVNTQLAEGEAVEVYDGPRKDTAGNQWYKVRNEHGSGWMSGAYLAPKGAKVEAKTVQAKPSAKPITSQQQAATSSSATRIKIGASVQVADDGNLRLRSQPSASGSVLATLAPGYSLSVVSGPKVDADGRNWYQVKGRVTTGWVAAEYIEAAAKVASQAKATPKPATQAASRAASVTQARSGTSRSPRGAEEETARPTPAAEPTPDAGVEVTAAPVVAGSSIAAIAVKFAGYRYVWGGTSPRTGFDCSGLVYYVMNRAGINVPRDMRGQLASGERVGLKELQPGDIVFFANTYKRGLSHSGLYIGDGKFIHAENESTGVQISDVYSAYYMAHYYTAVRPSR